MSRLLRSDAALTGKPHIHTALKGKVTHFSKFCRKNLIFALTYSQNPVFMDADKKLQLEEQVVKMLKTVYDPEIPVDIYSLGLVYKIDISDDADLTVDMTMTAPSCPMADFIIEDTRIKLESIEGLKSVTVNLVFEPEWNKDMMSEEAKLELGFL